ncbi:hypothetical protein [Capnocytophaga felis]|uniref:Uncharacterized protein n=2 Tax=Capnocytophaga felis TaxID=2267611 RepID=A0A5M4B7G4_9FLAO|nr:hypothetical protein [Capnocytophaga felis]GET45202.1 hypothetical protein RCZ01_05040 [Capnocytophaga felis]
MKTNVVMKSADRNLFGVIIKQNTKNGQSLSVTDLMKAYQTARFEYGWSNRQVEDIVKTKPFQERVYHLLNERGVIKMNIISFMQFIEK